MLLGIPASFRSPSRGYSCLSSETALTLSSLRTFPVLPLRLSIFLGKHSPYEVGHSQLLVLLRGITVSWVWFSSFSYLVACLSLYLADRPILALDKAFPMLVKCCP